MFNIFFQWICTGWLRDMDSSWAAGLADPIPAYFPGYYDVELLNRRARRKPLLQRLTAMTFRIDDCRPAGGAAAQPPLPPRLMTNRKRWTCVIAALSSIVLVAGAVGGCCGWSDWLGLGVDYTLAGGFCFVWNYFDPALGDSYFAFIDALFNSLAGCFRAACGWWKRRERIRVVADPLGHFMIDSEGERPAPDLPARYRV